jgi:hypothetical protein
MPPPLRIRQIHAGVVGNTPSRAVPLRSGLVLALSSSQHHRNRLTSQGFGFVPQLLQLLGRAPQR